MDRTVIINLIFELSKDKTGFEKLESHLASIQKEQLLMMILECGVLPEVFDHDSTEEKLWAKYSDILLAKSFESLGLKSQVIRVRGDSVDVLAESKQYKIVGDAKTFRLSRTAKNQKDFKVESLDSWRRTNDYAMLAGPFSQYPKLKSAIYRQAVTKNVTLLSYSHLHFMLRYYDPKLNFDPLWTIGKTISKEASTEKKLMSATNYWENIDSVLLKIFKKKNVELDVVKKLDIETTRQLGNEGIQYLEKKIKEYQHLSKEEAIRRLLKAEKIEAKIEQIKKAITWETMQ